MYSIISVLLTMPVSSATSHRSYSAMRRVEFYLKSNIGDERLSSLSLMHIHLCIYTYVQVVMDININDFVRRRNRRLDFSQTYTSGEKVSCGGFAPLPLTKALPWNRWGPSQPPRRNSLCLYFSIILEHDINHYIVGVYFNAHLQEAWHSLKTAPIAVQVQAFRIIYQMTTLYSEGIPDCALSSSGK